MHIKISYLDKIREEKIRWCFSRNQLKTQFASAILDFLIESIVSLVVIEMILVVCILSTPIKFDKRSYTEVAMF